MRLNLATTARVPYGVRRADGEYVSARDVPNGLKSNCDCPACGRPLVAKQGGRKAWHFAHHRDAPGGCYETALHQLAKESVLSLQGQRGALNLAHGEARAWIERAFPEFLLSEVGRRPDLFVDARFYSPRWTFLKREWCALEIAVANPKDAAYASDMSKAGIPAYELRLGWRELDERMASMPAGTAVAAAMTSIVQAGKFVPLWLPPYTEVRWNICGCPRHRYYGAARGYADLEKRVAPYSDWSPGQVRADLNDFCPKCFRQHPPRTALYYPSVAPPDFSLDDLLDCAARALKERDEVQATEYLAQAAEREPDHPRVAAGYSALLKYQASPVAIPATKRAGMPSPRF